MPRLTIRGARLLAFAAIVVASIYFTNSLAESYSQTLYENAVASCERNNPRYVALHQTVDALARYGVRRQTRRESRSALHKIEDAPYTLPDGETDCLEAIHKP